MASRYENNKIKKLKNGKQVYRSKIYPDIPLKDSDIYIVTQTGDRLDSLAYEYYGNSTYWWIISTANNIHDAPLALKDGTVLRIPIDYVDIVNQMNK